MSGGITQLVSIGAQDVHLTGQPEVSFFHSTYKRHTNFSHVVERQLIQGNPTTGGTSTVRFERKGDLLGYTYLTLKDDANSNVSPNKNYISKVELLIGGQVVDDHDDVFIRQLAQNLLVGSNGKSVNTSSFFYPLHFFFCESWQSALPLVALQYHDVELRITWGTVPANHSVECFACYVYLDEVERTRVSTTKHDMLITQTQKAVRSGGHIQELVFNHPVKFLAANTAVVAEPTKKTIKLQLNGTDVTTERMHTPHFDRVPVYHHCPYNLDNDDVGFLYPFCLDTNKNQPSGSLNFSRMDTVRLVTDGVFDQADIYAVNYNILRIQNGMGALMYAN